MSTIERTEKATAWQLRTAWAKSKPVVLSLSDRCVVSRVEGTVERVAVTGAFAVVDGWHIPTVEILGVASPHYSQRAAA